MAALILNKTGSSPDPSKSPFEMFFGVCPSMSDIKVFACLAIARVPPERRTAKLLPTTVKGIYLGRNMDSNTHIVFVPYVDNESDQLKGKLLSTQDVVFKESIQGSTLLNPAMLQVTDAESLERFWPIAHPDPPAITTPGPSGTPLVSSGGSTTEEFPRSIEPDSLKSCS